MKTRVVVLAASAQPGGVCVAGKTEADKRWVRPVASACGDGLPGARLHMAGGRAMVGDIVEMALSDQSLNNEHQTENRLLLAAPWEKAGRIRYSQLGEYADDIRGALWQNGESTQLGRNNRVFAPSAADGSLRLFRADNLTVKWVINEISDNARPYAVFRLNGQHYEFCVTDVWPAAPWKDSDCDIPDCFVCVSLTKKFVGDGFCHKLAACIITPERLP